MTPIVKAKLQAHLLAHTHNCFFPSSIGRPFNRGRVIKKILHPIPDRPGIPRTGRCIGLYAFRHSFASMLLKMTGEVAQRKLRHSDATFTVQVYGHVLGQDHTDAMEHLEARLLAPSVGNGTS